MERWRVLAWLWSSLGGDDSIAFTAGGLGARAFIVGLGAW